MEHPPEPGDRPPPGRLERPPGDRFVETAPPVPPPAVSPGRGLAYGLGIGAIGAAVTTVLAGVSAVTMGLLVVALLIGRFVAEGLRIGAGLTLQPRRRRWLALAIAIGSVLAGQVGIWAYARSEGGVLSLVDYLGQTFGWLVPAQVVLAAVAAWWSAR